MKKNMLMGLVLSCCLAVTACGGGASQATETTGGNEETIIMKLAHCNPEGDPTDLEAKKFAELVNEYTSGKIQVDIFPNAILGDWTELLEGLSTGVCDIMIEGFSDMETYSKMGGMDAVPFLYDNYDHFMASWHGDAGKKIMDKTLEDSGIRVFGPAYRGARIVTSTKRFENADELAALGLKIRIPALNMYTKTWQYLGTNPTPIALNEVLTCLQQNTVDAQENPCIMSYNYGFYDVCDYLIKTNHVYSATTFMIDEDVFQSYDKEIQDAILKAAEEASIYCSEYIRDSENEYFDKWAEEGCEIVEADRNSFENKLDGMVEKEFPELVEYVELVKNVTY